ncbi:MAG: hypothetical protein ACRCZP_16365 [Phycicoccus sp.]
MILALLIGWAFARDTAVDMASVARRVDNPRRVERMRAREMSHARAMAKLKRRKGPTVSEAVSGRLAGWIAQPRPARPPQPGAQQRATPLRDHLRDRWADAVADAVNRRAEHRDRANAGDLWRQKATRQARDWWTAWHAAATSPPDEPAATAAATPRAEEARVHATAERLDDPPPTADATAPPQPQPKPQPKEISMTQPTVVTGTGDVSDPETLLAFARALTHAARTRAAAVDELAATAARITVDAEQLHAQCDTAAGQLAAAGVGGGAANCVNSAKELLAMSGIRAYNAREALAQAVDSLSAAAACAQQLEALAAQHIQLREQAAAAGVGEGTYLTQGVQA